VPAWKVTLEYDGARYRGWQSQKNTERTVQGVLVRAARELFGEEVSLGGAGRTDAGVHALGQVAAFALERTIAPAAVARALNARLPDAVRVMSAEEAPASFHPRFARDKTYRYRMCSADVMSPFERRYAWHISGALDVDAMQAAAKMLEGEHNFAAFQATGSDTKTTVRTILQSTIQSAISNQQSAILVYEVTGDGFLRHMVRAIVGTLVEVGRGRRPVSWMADVLASRDRGVAGPTAPSAGLFLVRVSYG